MFVTKSNRCGCAQSIPLCTCLRCVRGCVEPLESRVVALVDRFFLLRLCFVAKLDGNHALIGSRRPRARSTSG